MSATPPRCNPEPTPAREKPHPPPHAANPQPRRYTPAKDFQTCRTHAPARSLQSNRSRAPRPAASSGSARETAHPPALPESRQTQAFSECGRFLPYSDSRRVSDVPPKAAKQSVPDPSAVTPHQSRRPPTLRRPIPKSASPPDRTTKPSTQSPLPAQTDAKRRYESRAAAKFCAPSPDPTTRTQSKYFLSCR